MQAAEQQRSSEQVKAAERVQAAEQKPTAEQMQMQMQMQAAQRPATTVRTGNLTGRAMVLGAVVVLLALVLASPLQRYLRQRDALANAQHERVSATAEVARLEQLKAQWADPAFVERQARARLQYARPGDTVYVVIDGTRTATDASATQSRPTTANAGQTTWQTKAWTSLQVADAGR